MQNGWETGKNKGNPYPELPLYLILYIVAAKNRNHTCRTFKSETDCPNLSDREDRQI